MTDSRQQQDDFSHSDGGNPFRRVPAKPCANKPTHEQHRREGDGSDPGVRGSGSHSDVMPEGVAGRQPASTKAAGAASPLSLDADRKPIAGAAHGLHEVVELPWFERLAQATDVHIDGALLHVDAAAPHVVEQLRA